VTKEASRAAVAFSFGKKSAAKKGARVA